MSLHLLASAARHRAALRLFTCLTLGLAASLAAPAQPWTPGQSYFGRNNYIEYRAGNLPIILVAGHGGSLEPAEIPDRNGSGDVTTSDRNTIELAEAIANAIFSRTGQRPHLIFSHLHRKKLDPNREIVEAARGNEFAEQAWHEFHDYIEVARGLCEQQFGFGFVADMHGHGHPIQRIELGYNFDRNDLRETDTTLNLPGYAWMSYYRTLALHRRGMPFHTLLRGPGSFGDLLNLNGNQKAWPSPDFPAPGSTDEFFAGGYNTDNHTCLLDNALINGIQFECHYDGVRDSNANRNAFATQFVAALQPFLYNHYGFHLGTRSLFTLQTPVAATLTRGGAAVTLTITRTGTLNYATTIPLAFTGTAVAGVDYTASASSVNFTSGQTSRTITLTPAAAAGALGDKTIVVQLNPPVTEAANTTPLTLTLGDSVSQTVRVTAPASQVSEAARTATYRFTRTHSAGALTVPLTWGGSAVAAADFHDAPPSVTFPAGIASLDVNVPVVDDGRAEPNKTLEVIIGEGAQHLVGFPSSATVEILDDDRPAGLLAWLRGELSNSTVFDSSGADRHATALPADSELTSGPTATLTNGAPTISFDGQNDTIALPRFVADPDGAFSVSFFFRLFTHASSSSSQSLLSYGRRGDPGSLHVYLNSTTTLRTQLAGLSNTALDITNITWQHSSNPVWRHYTLTADADGNCRVMIHDLNGNLLQQKTASGRTQRLRANELFWFGWRPQERKSGGYLRGAMRDIRIFDRAVSPAEAAAFAADTQTFATWLAQHGLPANTDAGSDTDADSYPALVEYATAARPAAAETPPRYTVGTVNDRLVLHFLRATNASDVTWFIEASADLSTWQTLASRTAAASQWTIVTAGATVTEINGYVSATDAVAASAQNGRFLRLRIER